MTLSQTVFFQFQICDTTWHSLLDNPLVQPCTTWELGTVSFYLNVYWLGEVLHEDGLGQDAG